MGHARGYGIASDVTARILVACCLNQAYHGGFCGAVVCTPAVGAEASRRRRRDDRPARVWLVFACHLHGWTGMFDCQKDTVSLVS